MRLELVLEAEDLVVFFAPGGGEEGVEEEREEEAGDAHGCGGRCGMEGREGEVMGTG